MGNWDWGRWNPNWLQKAHSCLVHLCPLGILFSTGFVMSKLPISFLLQSTCQFSCQLREHVNEALSYWWKTVCLWILLVNYGFVLGAVVNVMKGPFPQVSVVGLAEDCWPSSLPALGRIVGPGPGTWLHLPTPLPVQHLGTVAWLYAQVKALHGSADL